MLRINVEFVSQWTMMMVVENGPVNLEQINGEEEEDKLHGG
jgi:hypothetical protein